MSYYDPYLSKAGTESGLCTNSLTYDRVALRMGAIVNQSTGNYTLPPLITV
jgi:hypothetical protein